MTNLFATDNTLLCGWIFETTTDICMLREKIFFQDFLVILKRSLQNYYVVIWIFIFSKELILLYTGSCVHIIAYPLTLTVTSTLKIPLQDFLVIIIIDIYIALFFEVTQSAAWVMISPWVDITTDLCNNESLSYLKEKRYINIYQYYYLNSNKKTNA